MRPKELILKNIGPFSGEHCLSFDALGSIFLIYGETGAGKTTLFDALSYAFYGKPLGGRASVTKNLRSHFADESAIAEVILTFYLGSDLYRITRRLPYTKKSNKNETPEEVILEHFSGTEWENISSTNKRETDTSIKALIKLSEKEFSRIVLLPQGEFAQFLSANSTEKKETLTHLFPVQRYSQIMAAAKEQADTLKSDVRNIEKNLEALATEFSFYQYEDDIQRINSDIEHIRIHHDTVFKELKNKNTALEQEIILAEKRSEYTAVCEELRAYEEREKSINELSINIENARKALPLAVHVEQLTELETSIRKSSAGIQEKEERLNTVAIAFAALEAQRPEIAAKEQERDRLHTGIEALRKAVELERELQREETEETDLRTQLALYEKNEQELEKKLSEVEKEMESIAPALDAFDERQQNCETLQVQINLERKLVDALKKQNQQQLFFDNHLKVEQDTEKKLTEILRDGAVYTEQLEQLQQEKTAAEQQNQAAVFAETLQADTPCPVCGSVEHPAPAKASACSIFSLDERIAAVKRSIDHSVNQKEHAQKTLAAAQTARQTYEKQMHEYESAVQTLFDQHRNVAANAFPLNSEEASRVLAETAQQTEAAARLLTESRKALNTKKILETRYTQSRQALSQVSTDKIAVQHRLARVSAASAEKKKQVSHAFSLLPADMDAAESAETTLENAQYLLYELQLKINAYSTNLAEVLQNRERIGGELNSEKEYAQQQEILYAEKKEALHAACTKAGFSGLEAVADALCDEPEIVQWQNERDVFYERRSALRQKAAGFEKELADTEPQNIDELRNELERLNEEYDEIQARLEVLHAEKLRLEDQCRRYKTLTEELTVASSAAECAVTLSNDLNGSNARKLQFDTWALSRFLQEVTVFANERLNRMSEGRYRLEVSDEQGSGNGYKGLDLEITDAYTGKRRPSATLSGGETFMASISLALGLADSIQMRAGGIRIDSMFIDEGFGTLDEKALENAVSILDEIRGNRMVGIISHVGELQNRIPQTVEVVKTAAGSCIVQS